MMQPNLIAERYMPIWNAARPFLNVRNNDEHTLVAYALAVQFLKVTPDADPDVVLPTILLHDVGWKKVPQDLLLLAVGRKPTRPDLVRDHELYGVEIAREILTELAIDGIKLQPILDIIDGHDTDNTARSINDAVMKDADKGWRTTPHGMRTIAGWYNVPLSQVVLMLQERSNPHMLTPAGRALAEANTAAVSAELKIKDYLGHGPEFDTVTAQEDTEW